MKKMSKVLFYYNPKFKIENQESILIEVSE